MNRYISCVGACALTLSTSAFAQQVITPASTVDLGLNLSAGERRVRAFTIAGDDAVLLLLGSGQRRFEDARLVSVPVKGPSAGAKDLGITDFRGSFATARGEWLFVAGVPKSQLRNVRTGETKPVPMNQRDVFGAALTSDKLAVLGSSVSGSTPASSISIFDIHSGDATSLATLTYPAFPAYVFLSWASPTELLLIERATLKITPIHLQNNKATLGATYRLTGTAAEECLRKGEKQKATLPDSAQAGLVLAHLPGSNRSQFFVLAPRSYADGLPLVEYDAEGKELRTFRLQAESEAGAKAIGLTVALASARDTITIAGHDGVLRTYGKP